MQLDLGIKCDSLEEAPSLEKRASWVICRGSGKLEIPHDRPTSYLTHGLFRYAGKLPPPLVAYLLMKHCVVDGAVVDPMCGGGTTLIEAVSAGRDAFGFDINPVALTVSEAVSSNADMQRLRDFAMRVSEDSRPLIAPAPVAEYFSPEAYGLISHGLELARNAIEKTLMLSIVRPASYANTKKINTVLDDNKKPREPNVLLDQALNRFCKAFQQMSSLDLGHSVVKYGRAGRISLDDDSCAFVLLHPPYLTNTAFSELTQLQLALLGCDPGSIRERELAFRGSYFYVTNGLKKYLVGWAGILKEAGRIVKRGGRIAVVVGDGRIDNVRIPVGSITAEFGRDIGLRVVETAEHLINNQTGWTLSRRMTAQHIVVFEKE